MARLNSKTDWIRLLSDNRGAGHDRICAAGRGDCSDGGGIPAAGDHAVDQHDLLQGRLRIQRKLTHRAGHFSNFEQWQSREHVSAALILRCRIARK